MNLLSRHRSQPLLRTSKDSNKPENGGPQPSLTSSISKAASTNSGRLIRRVSSIFSVYSKKSLNGRPARSNLKHAPVGNIGSRVGTSASTDSSSESLDDIRQPNGLGPARKGSWSSTHSLRDVASDGSGIGRARVMSSPNILNSGPTEMLMSRLSRRPSRASSRLPQHIFQAIAGYLSRPNLCVLALTSRAFCNIAQAALYRTLDVRYVRPVRFDLLNTLLASRPDLGGLVETFTWHSWHPSFFSGTEDCCDLECEAQISILAQSTVTFALALQNMQRLKFLTLPSFQPVLLGHLSTAMLKEVTFLNHTITLEHQVELKNWLAGQPGLISLSFPTLLEKMPTASGFCTPIQSVIPSINSTPSGSPVPTPLPYLSPASRKSLTPQPLQSSPPSPSSSSRSLVPQFPSNRSASNNSSKFLPALETITAPPSIVTLLLDKSESCNGVASLPDSSSSSLSHFHPLGHVECSLSPLRQVTLHIRTTLYDGLRPSALLRALATRGIKSLTLHISEDVDRRTIEKLLGSTGAALGREKAHESINDQGLTGTALQTLELVMTLSLLYDDESIYRAISSALSRFGSLQTLKFSISSPTLQPKFGHMLPALADTRSSGARGGSRKRQLPTKLKHEAVTTTRDTTLTESEQSYVVTWTRSCPTLRDICFPSGAGWILEDVHF